MIITGNEMGVKSRPNLQDSLAEVAINTFIMSNGLIREYRHSYIK